jgi:oligopeptide/dipeptide ABC transporter ATP-binding protein
VTAELLQDAVYSPGAYVQSPRAATLRIRDLRVEMLIDGALRPVVEGMSLDVAPGEIVGIVGESGAGKSVTCRSIIQLLPEHAVCRGDIAFGDARPLELRRAELRQFRRTAVGMIFQDPRSAMDPLWTIENYLMEVQRYDHALPKTDRQVKARTLLRDLQIQDVDRVLASYPGQLSGGMLQRVMIAGTLVAQPHLIIADEATTALDVTVQWEILKVLHGLRETRGMSMIFITHDLELASVICDRIVVMYAGHHMLTQAAGDLFTRPAHPYASALLAARPRIGSASGRLKTIPGRSVSAYEAGKGCPFRQRCEFAVDRCYSDYGSVTRTADGALTNCVRADELRPLLAEPV